MVAAGWLALAGTSGAAVIASPPVFGAFFQQTAQCTVGNVGTQPVTAAIQIVDQSGTAVASTSCRMEPDFLCQASALSIATDQAYSCTATVSGSVANVRGNMAILDSGLPISASDLR
jgi:hypothetical protein